MFFYSLIESISTVGSLVAISQAIISKKSLEESIHPEIIKDAICILSQHFVTLKATKSLVYLGGSQDVQPSAKTEQTCYCKSQQTDNLSVKTTCEVGGNTASLVLADESPLLTSCFLRFNISPDCSFSNMTDCSVISSSTPKSRSPEFSILQRWEFVKQVDCRNRFECFSNFYRSYSRICLYKDVHMVRHYF